MKKEKKTELFLEGFHLQELKKNASEKLGVPFKELGYEILRRKKKKTFGLFGGSPYRVRYFVRSLLDSQIVIDALKVSQDVDGSYRVLYEDDGVFLEIHPPSGHGKPVSLKELLPHLQALKLSDLSMSGIESHIERPTGKSFRISQQVLQGDVSSLLQINVSVDAMQAHLVMTRPLLGRPKPTMKDLEAVLNKARVVYGIDWKGLKAMIQGEIYRESVLIAQGTLPVKGVNAKIEYFFKIDPSAVDFEEDQYGRVDLREMGKIDTVNEGQLLSKKIPATQGEAGGNVRGDVIPAIPGRDVEMKSGLGVKLGKDGNTLIALNNGQPLLKDSVVEVEPVLEISGDVNYEVGNIRFQGTVIIKGIVEDNFEVIAAGDIIVHKSIGKAKVQAGNDIVVMGGILGKRNGLVYAMKDVKAHFVEQGNVIAGRNIIVKEAAIHSDLQATGDVIMKGGRGALIGGKIISGKDIRALTLGSTAGAKTILRAGMDPEILKAIQNKKEQRLERLGHLDKINLSLEKFEQKAEELSDEEEEVKEKLEERKKNLEKFLEVSQSEIDNLEITGAEQSKGKIYCRDRIYSGVTMIIGKAQRVIRKNDLSYACFYLLNHEIDFLPYQ